MSNVVRSTFLEDSGNCGLLLRQCFGGPNIGFTRGNVEEYETDVLYLCAGRQSFDNGANCDFSGLVNRIAERSGRYRREGQRSDSVIIGDADGLAIATGERFGLVLSASSIHRTDGVNYIFGGQASAGGDDGFAGAVNCAVDASAAEQRRVGGVDDGFGRLLGDVGGASEFERLPVGESESGCEVGHSGP